MKRGFRFQWLALCVVIAVCAAAAAAGGAGAGPTAQERVRELRLQEAETRVRVAEEALHTEKLMVEEGLRPGDQVGERELEVMRAQRALVELQALETERVSLDVKDEPLHLALTKLFEGTGQSLVLDPGISESPRAVTLRFNDVPLESAVKAICKLYNLEYETDNEGLWVIMPSSGFATVGGTRVPIIGTVTSIPGTQGGDTTLALQGIRVADGGGGGGGGGRGRGEARKRPSFSAEERLVDLDVKDAPLSEVASRLSLRADPRALPPSGRAYNLEIIADDAVKDLKVTARIAKWPLGEVLDMLLAQTGLVCTLEQVHEVRVLRTSSGEVVSRHDNYETREGPVTEERVPPTIRVYLVRAPEMRVSGEGLPSEALVSRYMTISRADEVTRVLQVSRECAVCRAAILLPGWKYCPNCGAEVPAAEDQPEGAE